MNIISVSAEMAPWSKTGGLGDVCGALPVALRERGHRVMAVAPRYKPYPEAWDTGITVDLDGHIIRFYHCSDNGVDRVFIDHPAICRGGIYGGSQGSYDDNWFRFSLLTQGAILAAMQLPIHNKVYCADGSGHDTMFLFHDWHTSLLPAYLETVKKWGKLYRAGSALVIHNLAHQGIFAPSILKNLMLPLEMYSFLEYGGALNFLKAGMVMADRILTVSPTYAKEICTSEFGMGLDPILRIRHKRLFGILNGADTQSWNPSTDKHIPAVFSKQNLHGKDICKAQLQRELGLPVRADRPLFAFVSRLDFQKGVDQLEAVLPWLMQRGAQVVFLGTGDPKMESFVRSINRYTNGVGLVEFSNELAHKITAASDFLLMPSRFEPCGLTQQHALLYGTLPIVHATGGLKDTVQSFHPKKKTGNGWAYAPLHPDALRQSLEWALHTFYHYPDDFHQIRQNAMSVDRSWSKAAELYERVFAGVLRYK